MKPLIKTPRSVVHAALDAALTALAWLAFLYLFLSGIVSILKGDAGGAPAPLATRVLASLTTIVVYLIIAGCIAVALYTWAYYNARHYGGLRRRRGIGVASMQQLAQSFDVSPVQVGRLRDARRAVIHHGDDGGITGVEIGRTDDKRQLQVAG